MTLSHVSRNHLSCGRCIRGEAIRRMVERKRVQTLSLGSQQGNRHVHCHIAALPQGISFKQQQPESLRAENGILDIPYLEMEKLAGLIRQNFRPDFPE